MEVIGVITAIIFFLVFIVSSMAPFLIIVFVISKISKKNLTVGVAKNGVKYGGTQTNKEAEKEECVNDFDNTCEHAHLTNDVVENRYDVDEVVTDDGPIATDTYQSPIRKE